MKTATIVPKRVLAIALCAIAGLLLSLGSVRPAAAWVDSGWDHGYDDGWSDWDADEEREFAAEASREAACAVRRDELEKKKEAASIEHEAYFAEIVNASKASMNAPRDVYYRKPGWKSTDPPPPTAQTVTVTVKGGEVPVIYDQGIYWLAQGAAYTVVVPPFGVVVDKLPPGVRAQPVKGGGMLYYFFGVFYTAKGDKYEVVKPPAGTFVGYLPDGYVQEGEQDDPTFKFGPISYKQVFLAGNIAYQVI